MVVGVQGNLVIGEVLQWKPTVGVKILVAPNSFRNKKGCCLDNLELLPFLLVDMYWARGSAMNPGPLRLLVVEIGATVAANLLVEATV